MEECHSPSQLAARTTTSQSGADSTSDTCYQSLEHPDTAASLASSPLPIYDESMDMPCSSTPFRDISAPSNCNEGIHLVKPSAEHAWLPQFQKDGVFVAPDDSLERRLDLKAGDWYYASSVDNDNPADRSTRRSPELGKSHERAEVDTVINAKPWRNVDYLSHDWKEEEILSSWKYITTRRDEDPNSTRLKNAYWRIWTKYKNNLKTMPPEALNWLKDSDASWLYGPVQQGASKIYCMQTGPSSASLLQPNSLVNTNKKTILKKRSISDTILQRPLSTSSLPQQAAPVVQVRQKDRRRLRELSFDSLATMDHNIFPFPSMPMSRDTSSMLPLSAYTGISSSGVDRKHIHFNYKVEQFIAVEVKDDDNGGDCDISTDTNSEDGIIMKLDRSRKTAKEGNSLLSNGKTIAMLPSTTLKHREHIQVPETVIHYTASALHSHRVSPFSPQEASRPPKASGRFSEDLIDTDTNLGWYTSGTFEEHDPHNIIPTESLTAKPAGMRRTPSGMFMPYEEAVTCSNKGMFCRVIDTVKTAKDMAYVIWNSGWR
ncbi:protein phosphatase regulator [Fusarium oxysporum]|nr:protein phosphatase regulator [Fusarium oxysporum]KAJ4027523.1 protein phosphatase regulator [Fusarium oxysporum]KAJ4048516.1 protein phosphatase regulator [Fusarium oxysporum]KAJ4073170.1 protein phosphatase regulator [Fusarium oxysporum]KAJ4076738.1 protein phosphatase regulator [Fusarium oxysporum]